MRVSVVLITGLPFVDEIEVVVRQVAADTAIHEITSDEEICITVKDLRRPCVPIIELEDIESVLSSRAR